MTTVICLDDYHCLDRNGRKEKNVTALAPEAQNFDLMYSQVSREGCRKTCIIGSPCMMCLGAGRFEVECVGGGKLLFCGDTQLKGVKVVCLENLLGNIHSKLGKP